MSNYLRPKVSGARVFFTVNLQRRGGDLLVREINHLRAAIRQTRHHRPFDIEAWVVLPDHMHCVWALPAGDAAYAIRWGAIKSRFTRSLRNSGVLRSNAVGWNPTLHPGAMVSPDRRVGFQPTLSPSKVKKGDAGIWQRRFWEHHIRDEADLRNHIRYCHINPVKHGYVDCPEAWPYSSVHRDIGQDP